MAEEEKDGRAVQEAFSKEVGEEAKRMEHARRAKDEGLWFGLGTMGIVGWSIAVPTLLGILIGIWLDANWPAPFSWTLTLLVGGLMVGCLEAWQWVSQAAKKIEQRDEEEQPDE
ncbi:MAG TPA: AtpZ/AtpI family protein [Anaerolineae bacterium]|jgi:ATP synthase protein I